MAADLVPIKHRTTIELLLNQSHEYLSILLEGRYFPDTAYPNVTPYLQTLPTKGSTLDAKEIMDLRVMVDVANTVIRFLKEHYEEYPALHEIRGALVPVKEIVEHIDKVLDPPGIVRSNASKALATIRKELQSTRQQANRVFMAEVRKFQKLGWLRDFNEGSYNSRRVLASMSEYKRQIKGIIHGASDTGRTTFIEPMSCVQLNNEVLELEQEEKKEIFRILKALTEDLRQHLDTIVVFEEVLANVDFTRAKALLARRINAIRPALSMHKKVELVKAYHPLLLLQNEAEEKPTIPLSLSLDHNQRIIVISGPNAGGKSIALKTMGLLQIMLQSGLLIPAHENSIMCLFDSMLVDIGDDQSIEMELSTYSSRLIKMKYFLEFANKRTLFFIDEFGTGSDPELGGAVAEAILERVAASGAYGIVTTHYSNIKLLADRLPQLENASMLFDERSLKPLYQLQVGQPGSSYTFEVAKKIGLRKDLLADARTKVDANKIKMDKLLVNLQKEQNRLARTKKELQRELDVTQEKAEMYTALREQLTMRKKEDDAKREKATELMEWGRRFKALIQLYEDKGDKKSGR